MKKKIKKEIFNFEDLPSILGEGILIIKRELTSLSSKSEKQGLSDFEAKTLISYLSTLSQIKKDYLAETQVLKKEIKGIPTEVIEELIDKEVKLTN